MMNTSKRDDDFTWQDMALFAAGCLAGALIGLVAVNRLVAAMAAQAPGFWFVSRAAGIVAYVLLWASTAWGVSLSSKGIGGLVSTPLAYALHNVTSWLVIGFSVIHGLSLLGDQVVPFTLGGIVIPFSASYQPLVTGIGTLCLYVGIIVSVSFYWKKQIGFRAWRAIHLLSYLMFVGATVHGIILGTDTASPLVQAMYIAAGSSVLFLTLFRVFTARAPRPAAREGHAA